MIFCDISIILDDQDCHRTTGEKIGLPGQRKQNIHKTQTSLCFFFNLEKITVKQEFSGNIRYISK